MLKKLLTTKNVVLQHLLLIYETISEFFCSNFGQKFQNLGPARQKFLSIYGVSGGPAEISDPFSKVLG